MRKILAVAAALAVSLLAYSAPTQAAPRVGAGTPPAITAHTTHPVRGVQALKGRPGSSTQAKALTGGPYFNYALGSQAFTSGYPTTFQGTGYIANPFRDPVSGNHTLMEIAATHHESTGQDSTVEVGWTKDPSVCTASTSNPCMFVFSWVNGVPQGYGTGFVRYTGSGSSAYGPGDSLSSMVGTAHVFGLQIDASNGNIWVYFNASGTAEWVGYWPPTIWTAGGYSMAQWDLARAWAEVADVNTPTPCTDMGTGDLATTSVGAYWTTLVYNTGVTWNFAWSVQPSGIGSEYNAAAVSTRTGRLGGPGWNSAGTGVGTKGSC